MWSKMRLRKTCLCALAEPSPSVWTPASPEDVLEQGLTFDYWKTPRKVYPPLPLRGWRQRGISMNQETTLLFSSQPCSCESVKDNRTKETDMEAALNYQEKNSIIAQDCSTTWLHPEHNWWDDCKSIARELDLKLCIIVWRDVEMLL